MRILMLNWKDTTHPLAGGAEFYTKQVCERLAMRGHEVEWFTAAVSGQSADEVVNGVRIIRAGSRLGVYREAKRFIRFNHGRFDVIVDQVNTIPFNARSVARETPVVALFHQLAREVWFAETPLPVALLGRYVLEPLWLRRYRSTPVVTVSDSSAASLTQAGVGPVVNLGQGGELEELTAAAAGVVKTAHPSFVFCGRLGRSKRPKKAIEAFRLYVRTHFDAELHIIGDGPLKGEIVEMVRADPELQDRVTIHGHVSFEKRCELMAQSWALLVPSVREGWGLVVSEAAACGTRSIGYDVAGLRDSVPVCGGVLVDQNPAAMTAAMTESAWRLMNEGAPAATGTISWDELAGRWERFLVRHAAASTTGSTAH
jgi:glycosyltransferase involved in cell wall biosynthesis